MDNSFVSWFEQNYTERRRAGNFPHNVLLLADVSVGEHCRFDASQICSEVSNKLASHPTVIFRAGGHAIPFAHEWDVSASFNGKTLLATCTPLQYRVFVSGMKPVAEVLVAEMKRSGQYGDDWDAKFIFTAPLRGQFNDSRE